MSEETESPREALIHALRDFRTYMRKTALGFLGYAIVSLGLGVLFLFSKEALIFGAGSPFILAGLFLLWPTVRFYNLAESVNPMVQARDIDSKLDSNHQNRVMSEIALLFHLRTVATIVLVFGILILIPACVFHWSDAISSLSVALTIQGGLISVAVMMTNFWLEIYLNEIQRHLR